MQVPFANLALQHELLKQDISQAIEAVMRETAFIGGSENRFCNSFESAFQSFLGAGEVVGCANGTDAIEMLLHAFGIGPGHEVIVPANSWISTSEAVSFVGARPVFVDIDRATRTLDPSRLEAALTPATRAIIPVHLYGHPADMGPIMAFAAKHGLKVIEDCAQAHGALCDGAMIGTIGDAASFSFYPGKNLGALGDAGAIATRDPAIARHVRMLSNHGQARKHDHHFEGRNSRLDGLHAAVLSAKLPHLASWNAARRKLAQAFGERLAGLPLGLPVEREGCTHVYHLYVVEVDDRASFMKHLAADGIASAIHYPRALPDLPPYSGGRDVSAEFPQGCALAARCVSLPMFPEMTMDMVDHVCASIGRYFSTRSMAA